MIMFKALVFIYQPGKFQELMLLTLIGKQHCQCHYFSFYYLVSCLINIVRSIEADIYVLIL